MVVKRVGPISFAKINAVMYAIFGLIFGAFMSLMGVAGALAGADDSGVGAGIMGAIGVGAIVILPIVYACLGFVMSLIAAALYNVVSSMVGGIEVDLQ
jgi:hypothetical protein